LALSAPLEDRARLEHTIRLICRAWMAIEHSNRVVEQAEHQLERLEARARQRRHDHVALMARMHKILDRPPG
jgi:acetolactate synthase small subunit